MGLLPTTAFVPGTAPLKLRVPKKQNKKSCSQLQIITLTRRTIEIKGPAKDPPPAGAHQSMKNITVSIPDEIYLNARIKAARRSTSVSALVRDFLESLSDLPYRILDLPDPDWNIPAQPVSDVTGPPPCLP